MIIKKLPDPLDGKTNENEELFDSFIQRGGKTKGESTPKTQEEKMMRFSLRVPAALVNEIDQYRKKKFGSISRNLWILEAIVNYMKEDV